MKTFFITLLALPAILAAPAPVSEVSAAAFPIAAFECTCTNGAGQFTDASCLSFGGVREGSWCHASQSWVPKMETVYTAAYCAQANPALSKPECRPITLCQSTLVNDPNFYQKC